MIATYHNHSTRSDGKATISEIFSYGRKQGIDELGISDHFCMLPDGNTSRISIRKDALGDYVREIRSSPTNDSPTARVGLEVDWFEAQGDNISTLLEGLPLDYRIGAVHYVDGEEIDADPIFWKSKTQHERDIVYRNYWKLIKDMAESGLFDIAAHLDLPKKFNYYPKADMSRYILDAIKSIARNSLVVELNTAGYLKPCNDGYPTVEILMMCRSHDIPVTLSSDSHHLQHLLFDFERGLNLIKKAGFAQIARFNNRQIHFESI